VATYLLRIDHAFPERAIGRYAKEHNPDRFRFLAGTPVDVPSSPLRFLFQVCLDELTCWDALPTDANLFLLLPTLGDRLVELAGDDVQLLPATATATDGTITSCCMLNVTSQVHGIDHERSLYVKMKRANAIRSFHRLVLRENFMGTHCVAREAEYLPYILVSSSVRDLLEGSGFRGLQALLPEELRT
jgi:hypothetical protein